MHARLMVTDASVGAASYRCIVRFGVLGPLAAWSADGRAVGVPEVKVRALLADLLIQEGRPLSTDRLVDDLWGERPPGNPTNTLQTKISQLRKTLEKAEAGGRELVVRQPTGYLLRVEVDAVDAQRFRTLTARARATEDPRVRAKLLSDALALWRGPVLADFVDEPFAVPTIQRLDEERLIALEEWAQARLALGEHSLLVAELGDLVAQYPLRERLRALQLRALYQAGRQSEALNSYAELRKRLVEELGVEPGPQLAALHQAILAQDPALNGAPAPTTSAARSRTNLPAPLTELVGRTSAVREVRSLISEARLVTLTGPGGVGKTRLAMEAAAQLAETVRDGAWLVELAGLDRQACPESSCPVEDWVVEVVAAAFGVREGPASGSLPAGAPAKLADRLADALRAREILLVLDNCEQAIEPVAKLAARLLRAAPGLRIIVTGQEPLGLAGEVLWTVPPLDVPEEVTPQPGRAVEDMLASVREFSAVRLFVARAAAAAPGFALSADNAPTIAAICRRLDGIPLALELAATRVRVLGVYELLSRLDNRFQLLAAGHRDAPARQQTLRAMIDWSWELLTEAERSVLRRLAIHVESCTLEAAEEVCAGDGVETTEVLDLLARLVDRSLVVVVDGMDGCVGVRYRLLESVAAYCIEHLRKAGEFERVRQRHHRYYTALAERAEVQLRGPEQRQWLERLDLETANLRAALEGTVRQRDADLALRLVNSLAWYWFLRGRLGEAHRSVTMALSVDIDAAASPAARARAVTWQAGIATLIGDGTDLAEQGNRALKLFEDVDDPGGQSRAEWFVNFALIGMGDLSARADLVDRSLASFRALGDRWGVAAALSTRAAQALSRGELAAARRDSEQSAALFLELGDRWGKLKATDVLSSLAEIAGDYVQAARLHRHGLWIAEELGLWIEVSYELSGLGRLALLAGDYPRAEEFHRRAMRLAAEQSHKRGEQFAEVGLGLGARREGKLDSAEAHLRNWLDWCRQVDGDLGAALIAAELGFVAEQRGDPEAALTLHLEGYGAACSTGDPRAVALALEGMAGARALAGHHDQAVQLLGAAAAARESIGAPLPPAERGDVDRITAAARQGLGEEAFAAEFERGRKRKPDEARSLIAR